MYLRKVFNKQNIETFNGVFSVCHYGCLCGCFALNAAFCPLTGWIILLEVTCVTQFLKNTRVDRSSEIKI